MRCQWKGRVGEARSEERYVEQPVNIKPRPFFDPDIVRRSQQAYDRNGLLIWLTGRIGADAAHAHAAAWHIGTTRAGETIFWHLDKRGRYRAGKRMAYDPATAKKQSVSFIPLDGQQVPLYGEWLLDSYGLSVMLVESEKSALLGSLLPELKGYRILATGGASGLTADKAAALTRQCVFILPDADDAGISAYVSEDGEETERLAVLRQFASSVEVLSPEDIFGPGLPAGYDLADYAAETLGRAAVQPKAINPDTHWADGTPMPAHIVDFYADDPEPWTKWRTLADRPVSATHYETTRWLQAMFAEGGLDLKIS